MDIEYHFYITYIIALRAGFDKNTAYKIAYSSQYTDDNNTKYMINEGKPDAYENYISQTMNILKPKEEHIRIYSMFHFFPGTPEEILKCSAPRRDCKLHLFNTTPGNSNAQKLLKAALKSDNPCRIGIATHTFADTYAHQNFIGFNDKFNELRGLLKKFIPNIGHADAGYNPDWPALKWEDDRLTLKYKRINNKERFLMASGHIFELYCLYLKPKYPRKSLEKEKEALIKELSWAIGEYDKTNNKKERRINRYKKLIGDNLVEDYNKKAWFKVAVQRKRKDVWGNRRARHLPKWVYLWRENYKKSDWYMFQEAVKTHQEKAKEILRPLLEQMEIARFENW
jgi:hypothetical protein